MADLPKANILVLNKYFSGIAVCSLIRGISFIMDGRAEVIGITSEGFYPFSFKDWIEVTENPELADIDPGKEIVITTGKNGNGIAKQFFVPRIIRLTSSSYFPDGKKQLRPTRQNVLLRDENTCQYCGKTPSKKELNLDHVVPKSKGGKNTWKNLVTSCKRCNSRKADRTPNEAGMKLLRNPFKPRPVDGLINKLDVQYMDKYKSILGIK